MTLQIFTLIALFICLKDIAFQCLQRCNHFSAKLYQIDSEARNVPVLCDFTENGALYDFCTDVWNNCGDIPILNSPFVRPLQGKDHFSFDTSATKLTNQWKSRGCFCDEFGNSSVDGSMCFDGKRAIFGTARAPQPIKEDYASKKLVMVLILI